MSIRRVFVLATAGILCADAIGSPAGQRQTLDRIDTATIATVERMPGSWWSNGRTYSEQRFSPLERINTSNVKTLGLAWEADLASPRFGIEASPIIVDDVVYVSSSWGRVFAFDAVTGKQQWQFDPLVPGKWMRNGCCKPVNRGVAVWKGKVFVGAFDGRLIALDARTGNKEWEANTTDSQAYYTITGAPRVVKGKVVIGNGGADFGTRGFVSAYDAESGSLAWRFYIVPGDPAKGFEHPELEMAARTWGVDHDWSVGGGGNAWDSISYDPELDLLYVGTGNAGPYGSFNPARGDGLFLSSILALDPDTGRMAWHYQTTPGDSWDFNATQNMILAQLEIERRTRKVLMQAPKNGFFYVLDRETGELISAKNYVRVNWASGVDVKSGRPIVTGQGDFRGGARLVFPSPYGGHNWNPMAFSPLTGLVYIPAREIGWIWGADRPTWFMSGHDLSRLGADEAREKTSGMLLAWNPVEQRAAWTVPLETFTNGGVLATAGGLVVQGTEDGRIRFYSADRGELLHDILVGTGIAAPPISYSVGEEQYIAVAAGWNGVKTRPRAAEDPEPYSNAGRLIVLKLGGTQVPVAARLQTADFLADDTAQPAPLVRRGSSLYFMHCAMCHGNVGEGSVLPDLRRMTQGTHDAFDAIVLGGLLENGGMASFADLLDSADTAAIRAFVVDWAQRSRRGEQSPVPAGGDEVGADDAARRSPGL